MKTMELLVPRVRKAHLGRVLYGDQVWVITVNRGILSFRRLRDRKGADTRNIPLTSLFKPPREQLELFS